MADARAFSPRSIELRGELTVAAPPDAAFPLFSPLGERAWVPGWDPELLHPPGATWERGLLFRTTEERGEAIWVVTAFDPARHEVEYHRVEPGRYVAKVAVLCSPDGERSTRVRVAYSFVGLSDSGNAEIAAMARSDYDAKLRRWAAWIAGHLANGTPETR